MKKSILSAFGAFCSVLCAIGLFKAFVTTTSDIYAILAVLSVCCAIGCIGWRLEDTKVSDYMVDLFNKICKDD